ncbi:MAG: acylneuraminate cytidylyltransferase [Alphaproteobacteria bacterium]|nr:acylneuraminate cytidylyltransferase [Alphaproteobacteria bacterium]
MNGSRLYAKPLHYLDIEGGVTILDNIINCLEGIDAIDEIVLAISEAPENIAFKLFAEKRNLRFVTGDEHDVLGRLVKAGQYAGATDIFRVTSESPFVQFEQVDELWQHHLANNNEGTFFDDTLDGCSFEIINLAALAQSHQDGDDRHRSELCTLYLRENIDRFKIDIIKAQPEFQRKDLRLTVDYPEDLVVCRACFEKFSDHQPRIPINKIIDYLDQNPSLKSLIEPYVEEGYSTMFIR